MICFTSLYGLNITPKRKLLSKNIYNGLLVIQYGVCKLRNCTTESSEHGFGNVNTCLREFYESYFVNLSERVNIQMNTMFAGQFLPSRYCEKGYGAPDFDWIIMQR